MPHCLPGSLPLLTTNPVDLLAALPVVAVSSTRLALRPGLGLLLAALLLALLAATGLRQLAAHHIVQQHAQAADVLAQTLTGSLSGWPDRLAALPALARVAGLPLARISDDRGRTLATVSQAVPPHSAPAWFAAAMALPAQPAQVLLLIDGQALQLSALASPVESLDGLWQDLWVSLLTLLVLAGTAAALRQRSQQRLLGAVDQALTQAQHIGEGDSSPDALAPVDVPALQPLADGLQQLLARQRKLLHAQAEQLEVMRVQAHSDGLTGLPNRRFFLATLDALLAGDGAAAGAGLLLLRLRDLQGMNQRIGHVATDHVLQALGQTLLSYPSRINRCGVGRLNGADFALLLPTGGLADETAQSLLQALRGPLSSIDPTASVAVGVVELRSPLRAVQALALADAALASAEAESGFAVAGAGAGGHSPADADDSALPQGHASWQRSITRALLQGRAALGAYPVRTADGRQLHLDCPLRVQLSADGPLEPASRWLSQAIRSRLCATVDEKALSLALAAITRDGQARCINIAAQSVAEPEFIAAVSSRLAAAPDAACRLWIDLPEILALERPQLVRDLSRRWRPLGVMLGLEHAGEALPRMPRLIDLGLDCVRIDSRFVNDITGPEADGARRYLKGLVRLVQSVGLQACAEGVRSVDDLAVLWAMGFDAATGPALVEALEPA